MKLSLGKIPLAICLVCFAAAMIAPVQAGRSGNTPPPPVVDNPKDITSQP